MSRLNGLYTVPGLLVLEGYGPGPPRPMNLSRFPLSVHNCRRMEAQLARVGRPGPQVIGIDEIAIRKGHTYRIVVSDLLRGRPIWSMTARRRAWHSSTPGSAQERARASGSR
jgi:transposase